MNRRHIFLLWKHTDTTKGILDQYLLTGRVSIQEVEACLARHSVMPYLQHLKLTGLDEGLPGDETEAIRRLIRLRLLFVSSQTDDSEANPLENYLFCLRTLHHRLQAYIRNDLSRFDLETQVLSILDDFNADATIRQTVYDLRYTLAEDPKEYQRIDVVHSCFQTMRRLEALWFAVLE